MLALASTSFAFSAIAGNPIQAENSLPGDSSWHLTAPAVHHEIEGYASATSVAPGGSIQIFVNTADPSYTIDVYRMGWYGGAGARAVLTGVTQPGIRQVIPTPDPVTGLVECAWIAPYVLSIPDQWVTGIYLVKLSAPVSNRQSYVIFVVRDDSRTSELVFQSSVNTYEAYNDWGGKSLYYGADGVPAVKVSFNRPYGRSTVAAAAFGVGAGDFLTTRVPTSVGPPGGWEYNMVRWLERGGYDVSYTTDVDTHERGQAVLGRKGLIVAGHDEYWSAAMRAAVTSARDSGVNLAFIGADDCDWQIRYEPAADGTADRTIVCYKSTADPVTGALQTIEWRNLGMPQNSLVGVMYWTDNVQGSLRVQNTTHWIYAGAGLQDGNTIPGLIGYEVDAYVARDAPPGLVVLAHSLTSRGAYTDMTIYTAASGATVFAAGTLQWPWGLDDDYMVPSVRPSFHSAALEQMMRNLLGRFGVSVSSAPPPAVGIRAESAASGAAVVAAGSIASLYGPDLAPSTAQASSYPLPSTLDQTSVLLTDSAGKSHLAPLYFVSPGQINLLLPANVAPGQASFTIQNPAGISTATVPVQTVAPGLFAADATGKGLAAANVVYTAAGGSQTVMNVAQCSGSPLLSCAPIPVVMSGSSNPPLLVLYGTGIRGRASLSSVWCLIGGTPVPVVYAGPQPTYAGLDQVNVEVPAAMAGKGLTGVQVVVDGILSNTLEVEFK